MKTLAIWFAKRYALSVVQDMVRAKKSDVAAWSARVALWIERIGLVVRYLSGLCDKLADGELTDDEAKAALSEANALAAQITGE